MAGIDNVKQYGKSQGETLELGDKQRRIQFDLNAFGELERIYGSVDAAMEKIQEGKLYDIKVILWAGLIHEEVKGFDEFTGEPTGYNITPYSVGAMISSPAMLPSIAESLGKALSNSMGEGDATQALEQGNGATPANLQKQ